MKDPKGRKIIGFDKHVFVCENVRDENHPRKCCTSKTKSNIKILFKDGSIKDFSNSSEQFDNKVFSKKINKYFFCFPKEYFIE